MDAQFFTQAFAWFSLSLGLFTFVYRMVHPAFFAKLAMMQKAFGPAPGYWLHFIAYTVVPIVIGVVFLWAQHQQIPH